MNRRISLEHLRSILPGARDTLARMMARTREAILTPEPYEDPVEWSRKLDLPPEISEQGGPVKLYGYQEKMLRAPFQAGTRVVVVMKSARVGFSLLAVIMLMYVIAKLKFDAFLAQPTREDAHEFHDDFLAPLVAHNTILSMLKRILVRGSILDRWNKIRFTTGAAVRLVGAQRDDAFRRFKAFLGILDEVDADGYASGRAGSQGDKVALAERRLDSYPGSALVIGGTPTEMKTSRLLRYWDMCEQWRYFWPCQECIDDGHPDDGMQYLEWGSETSSYGFKWSTHPETGAVSDVHYQCRHNPKHRMEEERKAIMDRDGDWRVTRAGKRPGYVGLHIWEAYGFNAKSTWAVIVERFLEAKRSGDLQPFINLSLGEPYEDRSGVRLEPHMLASHCRPYEAEVPDEVVSWTWGIDTNKGNNRENSDGSIVAHQRHEASAWGWGVGNKPILLAHRVIEFDGEPFVGESAAKLDQILCGFAFTRKDGSRIPYATAFLDGGHAQDACIAYVKSRVEMGWQDIFVIRGSKSNDPNSPVIMSRKGKSSRTGDEFIWLNVRPAKDHLDRLLKVQTPGPRYVEFPQAMAESQEYFAGLLTETLRPERKGGALRWLKDGSATGEPWDCFVYAYAAQIRAQQSYPGIDRIITGQSPFSVTTPANDDAPEMYPGPDRSAMADKSEERGLVAPRKAVPPKTRNRAQRGDAAPVVPNQPEVAIMQGKRRRVGRSSMF